MLSNVADPTAVLTDMARDGRPVTPAMVVCTSPSMRKHTLRFGKHAFDMGSLPDLLRSAAAAVRAGVVTTSCTYPELTPTTVVNANCARRNRPLLNRNFHFCVA